MPLKLIHDRHASIGLVRYFRSDRCFNDPKIREWNRGKIHADELVTFDCGLMDMQELEAPDPALIREGEQILAVIIRPEVEICERLASKGVFEFCGYDLVETDTCISAITNCGAMFQSIKYDGLNRHGLIATYREAVLTQLNLREEDPEENHAYCEIVEVWRLLP